MVTGSTKEEVVDLMCAALQQHCGSEGKAMGNTDDEIVVRHMIHT
jgi:hypothetical protein